MINYVHQKSTIHILTCFRRLDGELVYAETCLGFGAHNKQTNLQSLSVTLAHLNIAFKCGQIDSDLSHLTALLEVANLITSSVNKLKFNCEKNSITFGDDYVISDSMVFYL